MPSGPGLLLCCAGEFQKGMEESEVGLWGHSWHLTDRLLDVDDREGLGISKI